MAKEISCEVLKTYFDVDVGEEYSTRLCEVKWNGRVPKGYDIRKYNKSEDKLYKGITLTYDGFKDLIYGAIEHGLVDINEVNDRVKKRKSQILDMSDFQNMFKQMNIEMNKYTRNERGMLKNNVGQIVIAKRRTK